MPHYRPNFLSTHGKILDLASELLHSSWMIKTSREKVAPNAVDQLELVTWQKNVQQWPVPNSIFRPKGYDLSLLLPVQLGYCKIITLFLSLQCQCTTNRQDQVFTFIPGVTGQPGDIFSEQKKNLAYITSYYVWLTYLWHDIYVCTYTYHSENAGARNERFMLFVL